MKKFRILQGFYRVKREDLTAVGLNYSQITGKECSIMKKFVTMIFALCLLLSLAACGAEGQTITVISREEGSGTRSAFAELSGVTQDGVDHTYARAEISSSTAVVLQTVAGNSNAIGYISLGAQSGEVKALAIDGIAPSAAAVKDGSYPLARPFLLGTLGETRPEVQDFLNYILSDSGQSVISDAGYVAVSEGAYEISGCSGTVKVAGSSSVAPVMEKLAEAYMGLNPGVKVEIQTFDSSTGLSSLADGLCDIAMSSRNLKDSETAKGIVPVTICMDRIAVIVHPSNTVENLDMEQLRAIFAGEITDWTALE